jgi:hypothetical protein
MFQFMRDAWPLITAIATVIGAVTLYFIKLQEWRRTHKERELRIKEMERTSELKIKESELKIRELEHKVEQLEHRIITPTAEDIRRYGQALRAQGYKVVKEIESAIEGIPLYQTTLTYYNETQERQVTGHDIIARVSTSLMGAYIANGTELRLYNTRTKSFLHDGNLVKQGVKLDDVLEIWGIRTSDDQGY